MSPTFSFAIGAVANVPLSTAFVPMTEQGSAISRTLVERYQLAEVAGRTAGEE